MDHRALILCIDRHQLLLDTLAAVLPRFGFTPVTASDPATALAIIASQPVDAVLLDFDVCRGCTRDASDGSGSSPDLVSLFEMRPQNGLSVHGGADCFAERLHSFRPQARILVWCADGACLKDPPPCAHAVLMKPMPPDALAAQLNSILQS